MPTAKLELVIIGGGGHAQVAIDAAVAQGKYHILGLVDKPSGEQRANSLLGYTIKSSLSDYPSCSFFVAIGDNKLRMKLFKLPTEGNT